jgi:hypothetical protein
MNWPTIACSPGARPELPGGGFCDLRAGLARDGLELGTVVIRSKTMDTGAG